MTGTDARLRSILHATTVALGEDGLLILGPSGAGKSSLALQMMALGADLVADDRTEVWPQAGVVMAACPAALSGLIEARGIGMLRAGTRASVRLTHVVDLGQTETHRLPPPRRIVVAGIELDLVLGRQEAHFPFALMQLLRMGRATGVPVDGQGMTPDGG